MTVSRLLIPPATNLFGYGQCNSLTDWVAGGSSPVIGLDPAVPGPFSPQSVKVTSPGIGLNSLAARTDAGQALAVGTVCVGSVYFLGVAGQGYSRRMRIVNTDASNTDSIVTNFNATGAWQLLIPLAVSVAAGKIGDFFEISIVQTSIRAESFWAANAMLQTGYGTVPAAYIPTSGGAVASFGSLI